MDDVHSISIAKTEYRDGFNTGDVERILAVFQDGYIDMSEGQPSFYFQDAKPALRQRLEDLFRVFEVRMFPMIINIVVKEDEAHDFGWHKFWYKPKAGGETLYFRTRYFERWSKDTNGQWKISYIITNKDEDPKMGPLPESKIATSLSRIPAPRPPISF